MTTIRRRTVLTVALAVGVLGMLVAAQTAMAGHVRPKGATPARLSFVPAYQACPNATVPAPNRTHGPALVAPSCNPPVAESTFLTTFTPVSEGGPGGSANMEASARLDVITGIAGDSTDQADVSIIGSVTDVRCKQNAPGAPSGQLYGCTGNGATGALLGDYPGLLQLVATLRITDHLNDTSAGGPTWPAPCGYDGTPPQGAPVSCITAATATMVDIPFTVPSFCAATPDLGAGADPAGTGDQIGSTCTVATTADTLTAAGGGSTHDGVRGVVEIGQGRYLDGGPDANPFAAPGGETTYLRQGIFIP